MYDKLQKIIFAQNYHFPIKEVLVRQTWWIKIFKSLGLSIARILILFCLNNLLSISRFYHVRFWPFSGVGEGDVVFLYIRAWKQEKQHLYFAKNIFHDLHVSYNLKKSYVYLNNNLTISFFQCRTCPPIFISFF